MHDSFKEPHLPVRFKMAECNCDHTLSHCVTVPGDSERTQYLRHSPESPSSSFSCHSHWEMAGPAATGHSREPWHGGMLAGQKNKKPPNCFTKPIFSKLTLWVTRFSVDREVKPWWKLHYIKQRRTALILFAFIYFCVWWSPFGIQLVFIWARDSCRKNNNGCILFWRAVKEQDVWPLLRNASL